MLSRLSHALAPGSRRVPRSTRLLAAKSGVARRITAVAAALASASGMLMLGAADPLQASASVRPADTYLAPASGVLTFTGHGWGHGIGMSQWGAYGAALQGLSATQILNFYYPGTSPVSIDPKTPVRVLLNTDDGVDLTVSPVSANGALTFTDVARNTTLALPTTVSGATVRAWRATLVSGGVQLQGNWTGAFQGYPVGAPLTVSGIARFTSASGVVRLVNPSGTQDDLKGSVDGVVFGNQLRTVERVGIDDMLPGVLGKEMSASWPTAALQAQAVAARSYTDFQVVAHVSQPYDVAIPNDFAYEGVARYDSAGNRIIGWDDSRLIAAVNAYPGDVRTYQGRAIFAMFSSSDGGYTVARSGMPYLVAEPDPYDAVSANPRHTWTANISVSAVTAAYPTIGNLTSIVVTARDGNGDWGGRTESITVNGTSGSITTSGNTFYWRLGLFSPWWTLPGSADPRGALEVVETAPGGAHISGWAFDPKTPTSPILVHIYVDGALVTALPANVDRPDLASVLGSDTAHGFAGSLALAPGHHTVCAYAINSVAGGNNPQIGCRDVQAYAGSPIGTASVTAAIGGAQISGWALDPESTAPVSVRLTVDGNSTVTVAANTTSSTVAANFPYYGANHGLSVLLPITGTHTVCVVATNVGAGSNITLACARVTVYIGTPMGALDAVVPQPGSVALWGWAIDPDTTAPIPVHIYVDGQLVAGVGADQSRPDVGTVFPVYGAGHGYSAIVPLAAGRHTVCTWALNVVGAGDNPRLGCKTVAVPSGDPLGHLDGVAYSGQIVVWGWAADPKTPTSPILVHVYVDGTLVTLGPAVLPRPDVATVFPSYGANHGFFVGVSASPGTHRVCVFAINSQAGGNNPGLGCGTVTVP